MTDDRGHYSDRKIRRSRSSSWTQEDERRWKVSQRREAEALRRAKIERQRMLDAMSAAEREAFLDAERAEQEAAAQRESDRRRRYRLERQAKLDDMMFEGRLAAGYLRSELAQATAWKEQGGLYEGDFIEDPVAATTRQGGFAEIVKDQRGIRLQVNIALDCSNSMFHNGLADVAVDAMRALYLALSMIAPQLPGDSLTVNAWLWARDRDGKGVKWMNDPDRWSSVSDSDDPLGCMAQLPKYQSHWTGEDTWLHPLLEEFEKWELRHGDHHACRLDLIITDGVLEHPTDARKGDVIQDRRDGVLQSVVLNFLPYKKWGDYRVPNRCVQYPVEPDTLFSLMRSILGDWLTHVT